MHPKAVEIPVSPSHVVGLNGLIGVGDGWATGVRIFCAKAALHSSSVAYCPGLPAWVLPPNKHELVHTPDSIYQQRFPPGVGVGIVGSGSTVVLPSLAQLAAISNVCVVLGFLPTTENAYESGNNSFE